MATRVGSIGLGRIGKPMAVNVVNAGFDVMVYDLRDEPMRDLVRVKPKRPVPPKRWGSMEKSSSWSGWIAYVITLTTSTIPWTMSMSVLST